MLHQYTRSEGHPRLVKALADMYKDTLGERKLDPMSEIITTVGATEGIYSTIQAFVDVGDEVILMQPYYDSYPASITLAGGVPVVVSLKPSADANGSNDWKFNIDELEKAVTPKTKMIILNNPHSNVN